MYQINHTHLTEKQQRIVESNSSDLKEWSQEDLREVYYVIEAKSSSYIKSLSALIPLNRVPSDDVKPEEFKEHFFVGTQVHLAVETKGESLRNLVVIDEDLIPKMSTNELKAAIADDPVATYVELYSNKNTKPVKEFIHLEYDDMTEVQKSLYNKVKAEVNPLAEKVEPYVQRLNEAYEEGKIVLNDLVSNPQKVYDVIENTFAAVNNSHDYNYLLTRVDEEFHELVVLWEYQHDLDKEYIKSMLDWVIIDHRRKEILLVDIKTHHDHPNGFSRSYKNHKYFAQLSVYVKALEYFIRDKDYKDYKIIPYILHVSTEYLYCKLERVSNTDIWHGEFGGDFRLYSSYNDLEELCIFMSTDEYNVAKALKLINSVYNKERYYPGFKHLLEDEYNLRNTLFS